jgi:DNA-binding XRE family transcriptional regulator
MENEILTQRVDAGLLRPEWADILAKATNDELVTFNNLCSAAKKNDKASRKALAAAFPGCGGAHAIADYNEIDRACCDLLPENIVSAIADKERQRSPLEIARVSLGYSIRQLAKLADVAPNTIANIEKGYSVPKIDVMRKLADVLGETLDMLWPKN